MSIFAPLWHHLYPESSFPHEPRLRLITQQLLHLSLAYDGFKDDLQAALQDPKIVGWGKTLLTNIDDMMRLFIPVVSMIVFYAS